MRLNVNFEKLLISCIACNTKYGSFFQGKHLGHGNPLPPSSLSGLLWASKEITVHCFPQIERISNKTYTHTHTHTTIKDLHAERRPQMKTWSPFMQLSAPQWTSLLDSKLNLSFKCGCIILLELGPTYVIWLNKPYCTKIVAIKIMLLREMGRPKWSPPGVHLVPPLFTRDIRSVSSKFHLPNGQGRLC